MSDLSCPKCDGSELNQNGRFMVVCRRCGLPVIAMLEAVVSDDPGFVIGVSPDGSDIGEPMLQVTLAIKASRLDTAASMPDRRASEVIVASELGLLCRSAAPQVLDAYLALSQPRQPIICDGTVGSIEDE